jgi:hypothetical protein
MPEQRTFLLSPKRGHFYCRLTPGWKNGKQPPSQGRDKFRNVMTDAPNYQGIVEPAPDFSGIKGQEKGKRGMLIAAAGGHNALKAYPDNPIRL